jgi:hypothetical protein
MLVFEQDDELIPPGLPTESRKILFQLRLKASAGQITPRETGFLSATYISFYDNLCREVAEGRLSMDAIDGKPPLILS